jgi:hypothetical protein
MDVIGNYQGRGRVGLDSMASCWVFPASSA